MRIQNKNILASILFVLISFVCEAQYIDGLPPPPPPRAPGPPGAPIDSYIYVFFGMALIYGIYRKVQSAKIEL